VALRATRAAWYDVEEWEEGSAMRRKRKEEEEEEEVEEGESGGKEVSYSINGRKGRRRQFIHSRKMWRDGVDSRGESEHYIICKMHADELLGSLRHTEHFIICRCCVHRNNSDDLETRNAMFYVDHHTYYCSYEQQ